jgi:hypothetical protein
VTGGRQHADGARQDEPTLALEGLHAYTPVRPSRPKV